METLIPVGLFSLALLQVVGRYFRILLTPAEMDPDPRNGWFPVARAVLDGAPLYLDQGVTSKPPLLHFVSIASAATGRYTLTFLLVTGLVNGAAAYLLYRRFGGEKTAYIGVTAALLFLGTLPVVNGTHINNKSFTVALVLVALVVRRAWLRGSTLAMAALFSKYAVFAIPVMAVQRLLAIERDERLRWFVTFAVSGLVTVAFFFGLVGVIWGQESMTTAIQYNFGLIPQSEVPKAPGRLWNAFYTPVYWLGKVGFTATLLLHLFVPAGLYLLKNPPRLRDGEWEGPTIAFLLALALALPLFNREYLKYWVLSLPFVCVLAAWGYRELLSGTVSRRAD